MTLNTYAECCYAECRNQVHYAWCHYTQCRCAECLVAFMCDEFGHTLLCQVTYQKPNTDYAEVLDIYRLPWKINIWQSVANLINILSRNLRQIQFLIAA